MNELLKKQRRILSILFIFEALVLASLILLYLFLADFKYNYFVLFAVACFFAVVDVIVAYCFNLKVKKQKGKTEITSARIIGTDVNEAYTFGQIGLAVCDHKDTVMWVNDFLGTRFNSLVDRNIFDVLPGLFSLSDPDNPKSLVKITYESHVYNVELLKEAHLYVFRDVTDFENAEQTNKNQTPVVGYIAIDNFSDVQMSIGEESKFSDMVSDFRKMINQFASSTSSLIRRIRDDRYLFITQYVEFEKILEAKFPIVDEVRNAFADKNGFTISIGVAYNFDGYAKLAELASSALDVALSRGGDQTVVAEFSKPMIYIGGKKELQPSRNRVKLRTLSNSFLTILKNYKNVIIAGHEMADFDAIGSALGVYLLCKYVNVPAKIAWEDSLVEDKCRRAVLKEFSEDEMKNEFISSKALGDEITDETLFVMVDHNDPGLSIFKNMASRFKSVAIIDHHRPGVNQLTETVFNNIDTSASSASEIITSYIIYNAQSIPLDARTATFLLAGITLDTRFFREHATTATFEVGSQLKNANADSGKVYDFMKEDWEEYQQKITILSHAETPFLNTLVCISPDNDILSDITLSRVANDGIAIRGITSSYCIGRTGEHSVKISARSDGSVNCQMLMEKLGGGGHFSMAAVQFNDISVEDAKQRLLAVLRDYLDEARVKNTEGNENN